MGLEEGFGEELEILRKEFATMRELVEEALGMVEQLKLHLGPFTAELDGFKKPQVRFVGRAH